MKIYNVLFWVWLVLCIGNGLLDYDIASWSCLIISQIMVVLQVVTEAKDEIMNELRMHG